MFLVNKKNIGTPYLVLTEMTNMDIDASGHLRTRHSWTTFRGMVWQLWLINKRFSKRGISGDFTVTLPLKPGHPTPFSTSITTAPIKLSQRLAETQKPSKSDQENAKGQPKEGNKL